MFPSSVKLCMNRTSRELGKKIQREISKTCSVPSSETLVTQRNSRETNKNKPTTNNNWLLHQRKHNNNRALSTVNAKILPKVVTASFPSKEESRDFMAVFPDLVRDLTEAGRHTDIPDVTKRFAKVLQYNVPYGKKYGGLFLVKAYRMLEDPEKVTPENIRKAIILGWTVEMMVSFIFITDDILDRSETRRGSPCWYRNEGVGLQAFNDALLIENGVYAILREYFSTHPNYLTFMELFHDMVLKTVMGQTLDNMSMQNDKPDLDAFTMKRYNSIVKYKTTYCGLYLPYSLAMYLAEKNDEEMHRQAKTILLEMGHFFQVQNDFLDCFGDPAITGTKGTDIREGKCSWLVVMALQRATPAQKAVLIENYGKANPAAEQAVKHLYEELGLPNTFANYEEESYNMIRTHIQQISKGLPHKLFVTFMEKLYRREC